MIKSFRYSDKQKNKKKDNNANSVQFFRYNTPFISTWKTDNAGTSGSTQITIPTSSVGIYDCVVDWGDGTTSKITTYDDAAWTHTYPSSGTYIVKIYKTFSGIVFNNGGDRLKILNISQWGNKFRLGVGQGVYLYGCANLTITAKDQLNLRGTISFSSAFRACTSIVTIPGIENWNVSSISAFASCFNGCTLFNSPLTNWTTTAATSMANMFNGCAAFNQPVSSFNTAAVTSMVSMFNGASVFNQSVSNFNTAAVTDFSTMFQVALAFNQSVSSFNTAAATSIQSMFNGASVFNQSVSNFNTAAVTTMAFVFKNASAFNQSVSNFNTASVTLMQEMFRGASAFNQDVSGWSIAALTNATSMFLSSAFNITNYNLLLDSATGWPSQSTIQTGVAFHAGTAHYDGANAIAGRATLVTTKTWTVTDGGTP